MGKTSEKNDFSPEGRKNSTVIFEMEISIVMYDAYIWACSSYSDKWNSSFGPITTEQNGWSRGPAH
jgi:hypothetical protein